MNDELKKRLMQIQRPFNPEDLTPQPSGSGIEGMTDEQRKRFERAVQGTPSYSQQPEEKKFVPEIQLTDEEMKELGKQFESVPVQPRRFQKILK